MHPRNRMSIEGILKRSLSNHARRNSPLRYVEFLATEDNHNSSRGTEGDINIEFTITRSIEHSETILIYTMITINADELLSHEAVEGTAFDYEIIGCNSKRCEPSSPGTQLSAS
jgi:hypothetical protein